MSWTAPAGESTEDPVTGYPIPGLPGDSFSIPCRFYSGGGSRGIKEFKNKDNTMRLQVGRIRVDVGVPMPEIGQMIEVPGYFSGPVGDIYRGQKTWRLDV